VKIMSSHLKEGDKAPDFTLPDQDGNDVRLYDLLEQGPVVLYFYPKAFTTVCTAEACAFRDAFEVFADAGAQVVGVSGDTVETQKSFHTKNRLSYPVLSDRGGDVSSAYGLRNGKVMGIAVSDRVTFVIDRDGTIKHSSSALLQAQIHVDEAMETVKSLLADSPS